MKLPLVVLLHGFNSKAGSDTTDRLIKPLNEMGYDVTEADYRGGYSGLIPGLFATKSKPTKAEAERIARNILNHDREVIIIGHSNGCSVAAYVCEYLESRGESHRVTRVILFNAALRDDYNWSYIKDVVWTVTPIKVKMIIAKW